MLTLEIDGARELEARFTSAPTAIRAALTRKFVALAERLAEKIRNEKLDGQTLALRDGRLRDSIAISLDGRGAAVSTRGVSYAAAQEYGFTGAESVAAHSREIKQAFGKAIAPKTIAIAAFTREMRLPERSYMRSALDEMRDEIARGLREAVEEGLRA